MCSWNSFAKSKKTSTFFTFLVFGPGLCVLTTSANAQIGPVETDGFLEYQYQQSEGSEIVDSTTQVATWRANAATYLWTPWILQLDGSVGITRTFTRADIDNDGRRNSTLLTGRLNTGLFQQSPFPIRTFVERLDSRVDSKIAELGLQATTIGAIAQFIPRGGGSYSLNFRRSENDRIADDGGQFRRAFSDNIWQANLNRVFGRNDFNAASLHGKTFRHEQGEALRRTTHNLRHKFRTSPRFYTDSTVFISNESFDSDDSDNLRKYHQLNSIATWRPDTDRPVVITARALLQGSETGPAETMRNADSMALNAFVSYQKSDTTTLSADIGVVDRDADVGMQGSSFFQRLRANYRSNRHPVGRNEYRLGSVVEFGNRRDLDANTGTVKDALLRLDHSLSRNVRFATNRQLQVSFAQQFAANENSINESERVLSNSVFGTYARQNDSVSTYVRLSATDRRSLVGERAVSQLLNLQASLMSQATRYRSLNGSITAQIGRNSLPSSDMATVKRESFSYSADLMYRHSNMFDVPLLSFTSELRLLSEDFVVDDPLQADLGVDLDRVDKMWRNQLRYRLGLLEFDLHVTLREIDDSLSTRIFLKVRRYYGVN